MTCYETEIIDAHIALENWLGLGEGDLAPPARPFSSGLPDDRANRRTSGSSRTGTFP